MEEFSEERRFVIVTVVDLRQAPINPTVFIRPKEVATDA
jgi:hypothetical protein